MSELLSTLIGAALISNLLLSLPLAADTLRGARVQALGPATALLIALACPLAWLVEHGLLQPLALQHLQLFVFLPLISLLAWLSLRVLACLRPALPVKDLWPLLLINGAGLGSMLLILSLENVAMALAVGIGAGLGFWLALQLFADLLERIDRCDIPTPFQGMPISLIGAGLMGLAFLGFNGLGGA